MPKSTSHHPSMYFAIRRAAARSPSTDISPRLRPHDRATYRRRRNDELTLALSGVER
jgi:hypothetical protein